MQVSDIQFIQRGEGVYRLTIKRPIAGRQYVERFVFIEFADGADAGNELVGLFRPNRSVPVRVFVIEDEVHRVLLRCRRRCASSSVSWLAFSGFWSSSAIVWMTL